MEHAEEESPPLPIMVLGLLLLIAGGLLIFYGILYPGLVAQPELSVRLLRGGLVAVAGGAIVATAHGLLSMRNWARSVVSIMAVSAIIEPILAGGLGWTDLLFVLGSLTIGGYLMTPRVRDAFE